MKHKYKLVIEFESEKAVNLHENAQIQFENGLPHFVDTKEGSKDCLNTTFVYGSGKTTLKKLNSKVKK